jgi:nucleoside-diphosphate-sugar epimerase
VNKVNILLLGGFGFFGSHFFDLYKDELNILRFTHQEYDMLKPNDVVNMFVESEKYFNNEPFNIINLLGFNGGIVWNKEFPATIFYQNTAMNMNVFNGLQSIDWGKCNQKIVSCLTSCAFPVRDRELKAFEILEKSPHPTVECHGYARRNVELLTRYYSHEFGYNATTFCPPTLFGPRDQLDVKRCKFLPAIIIKMLTNPNEVTFMGDGSAYREILFVKEACVQLKKCLDEQPSAGLRNVPFICEGVNKRIREFVKDVATALDYKGEIKWSGETADNGQTYKSFSKPWNYKFNLNWYSDGLLETINWYKKELMI